SEAERLLANDQTAPFLVIAKTQSKGRGRLGRQWHSPQNGNLYCSFAFRPHVSPTRLSTFTLWMGLNLCECINAFCRVEAKIKWPNDLHIAGKKVAGILTEARMDADETRELVLGIGLNINSEYATWPSELRDIATSLSQSKGQTFDLNRLAAAIAGRIMLAYQKFVDDAHRAELREKWPQYDALSGREVSLLQGEARIAGVAQGIDAQGALILERPDRSRFQVRAGEVTIEK
ncbi:MAG: biotin--[acetyl-CoA-carboxylase] ligase, partial [Verrucomicrobiota bacterium]